MFLVGQTRSFFIMVVRPTQLVGIIFAIDCFSHLKVTDDDDAACILLTFARTLLAIRPTLGLLRHQFAQRNTLFGLLLVLQCVVMNPYRNENYLLLMKLFCIIMVILDNR